MQEGDSQEVAVLKQSLLALMITFQERMDSTEAIQQQQTSAIQVHAPHHGGNSLPLLDMYSCMCPCAAWLCMRMHAQAYADSC